MPEYQTPEAPLTAEGQRQIRHLLNSRHAQRLQTHLKHAVEKLTDTAGDINEKLTDARVRYEKMRQLRRDADADADGDGDGDGPAEDEDSEGFQLLAERERKVADVTARMEEKMRQVIDSEARYQNLLGSVSRIETEEGVIQDELLGARTRGQRRRRRHRSQSEEDGEDERDEDYEATPERETRERNAQNPPSRRLDDALTEGAGKWNGLSLTEK